MVLNRTEQKAKEWLIRKGYKEEEIIFNAKGSPDFTTADGKGYEVKRLYGSRIIIYGSQYEQMQKLTDVTLLVFDDEREDPRLQIPFTEIRDKPSTYQGIYISWVPRMYRISVDMPIEMYNKFAKKCIDVDKKHVEVLRDFIGQWINIGSWNVGSWR